MRDPFDLARFLQAQDPVIGEVQAELRRGRKDSHWMWFIFPQLRSLGRSPMAQQYGIASRAEAEAYLAHPVLGSRLMDCTRLVNLVERRSIEDIFGGVDALKFRSSMTLFTQVTGSESVFVEALHKYYDGQPDQLTLERL